VSGSKIVICDRPQRLTDQNTITLYSSEKAFDHGWSSGHQTHRTPDRGRLAAMSQLVVELFSA
jgi:hypothetical protein